MVYLQLCLSTHHFFLNQRRLEIHTNSTPLRSCHSLSFNSSCELRNRGHPPTHTTKFASNEAAFFLFQQFHFSPNATLVSCKYSSKHFVFYRYPHHSTCFWNKVYCSGKTDFRSRSANEGAGEAKCPCPCVCSPTLRRKTIQCVHFHLKLNSTKCFPQNFILIAEGTLETIFIFFFSNKYVKWFSCQAQWPWSWSSQQFSVVFLGFSPEILKPHPKSYHSFLKSQSRWSFSHHLVMGHFFLPRLRFDYMGSLPDRDSCFFMWFLSL